MLVSLAIAAAGCSSTGQPTSADPEPRGAFATRASKLDLEFEIRPYIDAKTMGNPITFSSRFDGRPVVLNFWGGTCPPCKKEMPDFQRVYQRHKSDVEFVGVDLGSYMGLGTRETGMKLVDDMGIRYPAGITPDGNRLIESLGIDIMPTTVFFSAQGVPVFRKPGSMSEDELERTVQELIAGKLQG